MTRAAHRAGAAAGIVVACVLAPGPARASLWAIDRSIDVAFEANDNYRLNTGSAERVETFSLSGVLSALRQTESESTRIDTRVTGYAFHGETGQNHFEGQLGASQTWSAPVDDFQLGANYQRVNARQTPATSTDLLVATGERSTASASGQWEHHLSERLSAIGTAAVERTSYGTVADGTAYLNASGSGSVQYAVDERDSVNARVGHSQYQALNRTTWSVTDSVGVGFSRALSEQGSASLNIGRYRTRTESVGSFLACPLPSSYCSAGIVDYTVVYEPVDTTRWGLQYSASYNHQFDEVTSLAFGASRQLTPSGAGVVVRSDALSLGASRALSPTLSGDIGYARSRSIYQGTTAGPQPGLQTLNISLSKALDTDLALRAGYRYSRSDEPVSGRTAHSSAVTLNLHYGWPRAQASR